MTVHADKNDHATTFNFDLCTPLIYNDIRLSIKIDEGWIFSVFFPLYFSKPS